MAVRSQSHRAQNDAPHHAVTDDFLVDLLGNNVQVNDFDPNWNCLDWVYDALTVLVATGVMEPLSCSPFKLWEIGARYADGWRVAYNHNRHLIEPGTPIPCCDAHGNPLPSPLS
ncbi:hypothetical protein F5887DRAFT_918456 [Amanita rubescens]|nr:hypothetical protein F5887DRAFT_918456 [Amanita rubescens]